MMEPKVTGGLPAEAMVEPFAAAAAAAAPAAVEAVVALVTVPVLVSLSSASEVAVLELEVVLTEVETEVETGFQDAAALEELPHGAFGSDLGLPFEAWVGSCTKNSQSHLQQLARSAVCCAIHEHEAESTMA